VASINRGAWSDFCVKSVVIFGSGRVASALATGLVKIGRSVTLAVRSRETALAKWSGPNVTFASLPDAVGDAEIAINATSGEASVAALSPLKAALKGKVLIDVANATVRGQDGMPGGLAYPNSSLAETLQAALPDTFVVKTLNTVFFNVMANPGMLASPASIFISGNDDAAKVTTRGLLLDLGWQDQWVEDLGGIESARGTEALILLAPYLIRARGLSPFALTAVR
jgi:predicted dinucleotide-binding enzyme